MGASAEWISLHGRQAALRVAAAAGARGSLPSSIEEGSRLTSEAATTVDKHNLTLMVALTGHDESKSHSAAPRDCCSGLGKLRRQRRCNWEYRADADANADADAYV